MKFATLIKYPGYYAVIRTDTFAHLNNANIINAGLRTFSTTILPKFTIHLIILHTRSYICTNKLINS